MWNYLKYYDVRDVEAMTSEFKRICLFAGVICADIVLFLYFMFGNVADTVGNGVCSFFS
jgi:hypothetical protein